MAFDKKLCCFGVAFMLLCLGTFCSAQYQPFTGNAQQWTPPQGISKGATTQWSGSQKTRQPTQKMPMPMPQWPQQKTPQVADPMPTYPQQKTPQVADPMPTYPQQKTPQVADPMPKWPQQKTPQVADPMPQWPQQKTPQVADPMPKWPQQKTPQVADPMPQWPQQKTPKVADPRPQWPQQRTPQVADPMPQWPQQRTPQVADPKPQWPPQRTPQVADPKPQWPPQRTPQVADPKPQWPPQRTPQVADPKPQWPPQRTPQEADPNPQWPPQRTPQEADPRPQWMEQGYGDMPQRQPTNQGQKMPQWQQANQGQTEPQSKPGKKTTTPVSNPPNQVQKCNVPNFDRIQCGEDGITSAGCQAMDCCFDNSDNECFYGNTVTLHCTKDAQIVIVVSTLVTLPPLNADSIRWISGATNSGCLPVFNNPDFAIYQFPATDCGTNMREENGFVIYENQMSSSYDVSTWALGTITRDSHFELGVQCRYKGDAVEALVIEVLPVPPPNPVAAPGPLRVEFRLGNGKCTTKGCNEDAIAYQSYYTPDDYPLTLVLQDPFYAEVHIPDRTDPNICLNLGRCWATTTTDPNSMPQWGILDDGCPFPNDRNPTRNIPVEGVEFPNLYKRFMQKMFAFMDQLIPVQTTVFIHCETSVSTLPDGNPCEKRCSQPVNRFKRDIAAKREETGVVSSGAIVIKA